MCLLYLPPFVACVPLRALRLSAVAVIAEALESGLIAAWAVAWVRYLISHDISSTHEERLGQLVSRELQTSTYCFSVCPSGYRRTTQPVTVEQGKAR